MAGLPGLVQINLLGPFRMLRSDGVDCTPTGRKACAIIAMLCLSRDLKRTRAWLQDKLWSSRGKEHGAASLRQSLSELRRALDTDKSCLISTTTVVSLDRRAVAIDIDTTDDLTLAGHVELLEGLDIGDQEFEDWLREERERFSRRRTTAAPPTLTTATADPRPAAGPRTGHRLLLEREAGSASNAATLVADGIVDSIARTISELGGADIVDSRGLAEGAGRSAGTGPEITLSLRSNGDEVGGTPVVRFALRDVPSNALVWSRTLPLRGNGAGQLNDPDVLGTVNLAVNIATDQFNRQAGQGSERALAAHLTRSGINHLFRLGKANFRAADLLFERAFDLDGQGIHLAWRAYLRTFMLAERQFTCRQTLDQEALDFIRRALELAPYNSYVAALAAHVQTIIRRSYVAAHELAERSLELNHANPIGWACLGVAKSYLGKPEEGFQHTLMARSIAGSTPFRYQLDALSCIVGTMAGDYDKAIYLAEASHALAPDFAPPLRYLAALYFKIGRLDLSRDMIQRLRTSEPDFGYDKLRDKSYPAAGLHWTPIINQLPSGDI